MPTELEVKLRLARPDELVARLAAVGARAVGTVLEINRIFDTPERRLLSAGCGLRLRTCRDIPPSGGVPKSSAIARDAVTPAGAAADRSQPGVLTFKGPRAPGPLKQREELETAVEDAAAALGILQGLGFAEVIRYEKRRSTWDVVLAEGTCEVTLDELPRLGWFAEIEGPNAAAIARARELLQLEAAPVVGESYVELAAQHGTAGPAGQRRLLFADAAAV